MGSRSVLVPLASFVEKGADRHEKGKYDKVEEHGECELTILCGVLIGANAVRVNRDEHHKERCNGREAAERGEFAFPVAFYLIIFVVIMGVGLAFYKKREK